MALIPRLASFSPDRFVLSYLPQVGEFLMVRRSGGRGPAQTEGCLTLLAASRAARLRLHLRDAPTPPPRPVAQAALQKPTAERGPAFLAVGQLAGALEGSPRMGVLLPTIADAVADALAVKKKRPEPCPEAMTCAGELSRHMGPLWEPFVSRLLEPLFATGLSEALVEALGAIANATPSLRRTIQARPTQPLVWHVACVCARCCASEVL